jgi:hypothetical protein
MVRPSTQANFMIPTKMTFTGSVRLFSRLYECFYQIFCDLYRDIYNQDMSKSSVFWGTTYAEYNGEQYEKHKGDLHNGEKVKVFSIHELFKCAMVSE